MAEYKQSGSAQLKNLTLTNYDGSKSVDLTAYFRRLNITQDLMMPFIFGDISIEESIGIYDVLPIVGMEKLKIVFTTQDGLTPDRDLDVMVYKMSNKDTKQNRVSSYTLHFASEEFVKGQAQVISKAFTKMSIEDIQKATLQLIGSTKAIEVAPSKNIVDLLIPRMTVAQALMWIPTFGLPAEYQGASYLFFEGFDGFVLKTLEDLMVQEPVSTLNRIPVNFSNNDLGYRNEAADKNIRELQGRQMFDVLKGAMSGLYSNKAKFIDPLSKTFEVSSFSYKDFFEKAKHLETSSFDMSGLMNASHPYFSNIETNYSTHATQIQRLKSGYLRSKGEVTKKSKQYSEATQSRNHQMASLDQITYGMQVPGDSTLDIGKCVLLQLPAKMLKDDAPEGRKEKFYNGKFLISKLIHTIDQTSYMCEVEIVKDSLQNQIEADEQIAFTDNEGF